MKTPEDLWNLPGWNGLQCSIISYSELPECLFPKWYKQKLLQLCSNVQPCAHRSAWRRKGRLKKWFGGTELQQSQSWGKGVCHLDALLHRSQVSLDSKVFRKNNQNNHKSTPLIKMMTLSAVLLCPLFENPSCGHHDVWAWMSYFRLLWLWRLVPASLSNYCMQILPVMQ